MPYTSVLSQSTGGWQTVFYLAAGMAALSSLMAIFVLKPMRARQIAQSEA